MAPNATNSKRHNETTALGEHDEIKRENSGVISTLDSVKMHLGQV